MPRVTAATVRQQVGLPLRLTDDVDVDARIFTFDGLGDSSSTSCWRWVTGPGHPRSRPLSNAQPWPALYEYDEVEPRTR